MKTKMKRLDHTTLAEGEVTGHSHQARGGVLYEEAGNLVLERGSETTIEHEEHGPFALPGEKGKEFDVRKVQEMDHAANAVRSTED